MSLAKGTIRERHDWVIDLKWAKEDGGWDKREAFGPFSTLKEAEEKLLLLQKIRVLKPADDGHSREDYDAWLVFARNRRYYAALNASVEDGYSPDVNWRRLIHD